MTEAEQRFWRHVAISSDAAACWPWTASKNTDGYGQARFEGRVRRASRLAYFLFYRVDPADMCVRHDCDNPACCNPFHLRLGTQRENVRDMFDRRRENVPSGDRHAFTKLSDARVQELRASRLSAAEAAVEFGICVAHVYAIRSGKARTAGCRRASGVAAAGLGLKPTAAGGAR